MSEQDFTVFVFSPSCRIKPGLAIAATRGGGIGVINAELETDPAHIFECLSHMEHPDTGAKGPYGLKLAIVTPDLPARLAPYLKGGLSWLILDKDAAEGWSGLAAFRKAHDTVKILVECTDSALPACARKGLIDGIIVKGNESGGFVGEEASFILLQKWTGQTDLPLYVRGGLTPHTAAACHAMGVTGGVLDSQVLLLNDSPLAQTALRRLLATLSGSETIAAGNNGEGFYFRVLNHPQLKNAKDFIAQSEGLSPDALRALVANAVIDWSEPKNGLLPVGHDVCFAESWRKQYGTVSSVLKAIAEAVERYAAIAANDPPLRDNGPLAEAIGTKLPIVQGPMTRVSDVPAFARAVADGGALPMIAFALLKGAQVAALLEESGALLDGRKWGIGLLGFVPPELLNEQIAAALPYRPDYAIIAGGRPDQAVALEERGIPAFLHVPSASLLAGFLKGGARRFIFEGRECGGHIGPLSSFVLWSSMIDRILVSLEETGIAGADIQCLFAGGIHDPWSAAFLQIMAAPLIEKNVRIGIIMGSAYLFTREIVESGAIVDQFQKICLECDKTVVLETGAGHASRCALTPFAQTFFEARVSLKARGDMAADTVRESLDKMILGTLRMASKGLTREGDTLVGLDEAEQKEKGMYMLGQVVPLRREVIAIADLHHQVTAGAAELLKKAAARTVPARPAKTQAPADIAIVGMACALPGAKDVEAYWDNILDKINTVTEIPRHRWDSRLYFDEDRHKDDKIYSKWGGFLADMPFDPLKYGITPKSIESVDPMQLMALEIAHAALKDARYSFGKKDRDRTSVIIGASGGAGDVGAQYGLRAELPRFGGDLPKEVADRLPEWTEDTFAGILINVVAGRITNRLDLGGANFTTDAACASSMAAIYQAVLDLSAGNSDTVIAGGVDTVQGPFGYMCFSKTQALSPRGVCNTFDQSSDGIVISEGIAMLVLKRLKDAERDGDRVYAVIKGAGVGSDGKAKGLSAPLPAGQLRAMRRAYEQAGFSPATIRIFEAHGTGTAAGDTAELESTSSLLKENGAQPRSAVIGSVKTMIGHTKASAGSVGLQKAALALHHKILPPHLGVKNPNPVLADQNAPLYLIDDAQPWLDDPAFPRRAAVSAFGFGGTNFHIVLEEYKGEYRDGINGAPRRKWPAELFMWRGGKDDLAAQLEKTQAILAQKPDVELRDLAFALAKACAPDGMTISIVADNFEKLDKCITAALSYIKDGQAPLPQGVYVGTGQKDGKLAVLFSGQGSQYPDMLREAAAQFPLCAGALTAADSILAAPFENRFGKGMPLSRFIFPRGAYSEDDRKHAESALKSTDVAQPALGAIEAGLWAVMKDFGLMKADMLAGHSYGEFVALYAAEKINFTDLMRLSEARGRLIVDEAKNAGAEPGVMAAVRATRSETETAIKGLKDIVIANHNAPEQVILSGSRQAIEQATAKLAQAGKDVTLLPVAAAFHSPFVAPARDGLAKVIAGIDWQSGDGTDVYSNNTARPHGPSVQEVMADHLVNPVEFVAEIEAMYADGARVFLELGPKAVLAGLTRRILGERPHTAVAFDGAGGGLTGMLHAFAQLLCAGVPLDVLKLFDGRNCLDATLATISDARRNPPPPKHAWMLNGSGARRATDPVRQIGVTAEQAQDNKHPVEHAIPAQSQTTLRVPSTLTTPDTTQRRAKQTMSNPYTQQSVAAAYFELLERQLNNARDVALAELGAAPSPVRQHIAASPVNIPARRTAAPLPAYAAAPQQRIQAPVPPAAPPAATNGHTNGHAPAAAVEAKPAAPTATNGTKTLDETRLKDVILSVVSDKTGYEADMIEFNQNMEADLGIDSIKRVEIVGGVLDMLPDSYAKALGDSGRTKLSTAATLGKMLALLSEAGGQPVNFNEAGTGVYATGGENRHPSRPTQNVRFKLVSVREDIPARANRGLTQGAFILTPDRLGVVETLARLLEQEERTVHRVPADALSDETAFLSWYEKTGQSAGPIAGIVHLAALGSPVLPQDETVNTWQTQLFANEKILHLLLRHFSGSLADRAHVLAASALGGTFGRENYAGAGLTLQGGASGLIKSFCKEREDIRGKAVDLDPAQNSFTLAAHLFAEIELDGGRREVGYPGGQRTVFKTAPAPLPDTVEPLHEKGLVVLATGGARGVTAEVLREVAKPGNILILTGRNALPGEDRALRGTPETAALTEEKDLARHFIKAESLNLGEARRKAKSVLAAREQLDNISDFKASGASVEYHAVDVTDETAMAALLGSLYEKHGKIDGIVHGAGIIEDKYLADITPDSWSRVVDTKVIGLLLLQKYVRPDSLKFFTVFSSVAGRYGNSGQSNYAQANELMNRLCSQLQAIWTDKVRINALCWGPWGRTKFGAGMVTEATEEKFAQHGVALVSAEDGRSLFLYQVTDAQSGVEIVCGGGPWEQHEAETGAFTVDAPSALIGSAPVSTLVPGQSASIAITLDRTHAYLQDHIIDESPVLPMAFALEIMAQAAAKAFGENCSVVEINGGQLFRGVTIDGDTCDLTVVMTAEQDSGVDRMSVKAKIVSAGEKPVPHYGAVVVLAKSPSRSEAGAPMIEGPSEHMVTAREAYDDWLFHGPRFQVIDSIGLLSGKGAQCMVRTTKADDMMEGGVKDGWLFDPGLVDAAAHMSVLWMGVLRDTFALPVKFGRIVRYAHTMPQAVRMDYIVREENGETLIVDTYFSDEAGQVVLLIEGMQHIASKTHKVGAGGKTKRAA